MGVKVITTSTSSSISPWAWIAAKAAGPLAGPMQATNPPRPRTLGDCCPAGGNAPIVGLRERNHPQIRLAIGAPPPGLGFWAGLMVWLKASDTAMSWIGAGLDPRRCRALCFAER